MEKTAKVKKKKRVKASSNSSTEGEAMRRKEKHSATPVDLYFAATPFFFLVIYICI